MAERRVFSIASEIAVSGQPEVPRIYSKITLPRRHRAIPDLWACAAYKAWRVPRDYSSPIIWCMSTFILVRGAWQSSRGGGVLLLAGDCGFEPGKTEIWVWWRVLIHNSRYQQVARAEFWRLCKFVWKRKGTPRNGARSGRTGARRHTHPGLSRPSHHGARRSSVPKRS
jgi:hypothetical protein